MARCNKCSGFVSMFDDDTCSNCKAIEQNGYDIDYQIQVIEKEINRRLRAVINYPRARYPVGYVDAVKAVLKTLNQVKRERSEGGGGKSLQPFST